MSSEHRRNFFQGVKEHSEVKLRAFERYLTPWTAKVSSRQGTRRVWIVDGFAGPGTYESGQLGSPAIALAHAREAQEARPTVKVSCIFAEATIRNAAKLKTLSAAYRDVEVIPIPPGDFWARVGAVADFVQDEPAFVFIDPFGLGDLKFGPLIDLCSGLKRIDLMVNFASPAARRLKSGNAELIDEAVGGPGWTVDTVTQTFCSRLAQRARFRPPAVLPVTGVSGSQLKYELVMAARHPAAYELWNDEIARDEADVVKAGGPPYEALLQECRADLEAFLTGRESFVRDRLFSELAVQDCGDHHRSTYIRAVSELARTGQWIQGPRPVGRATFTRA